MHNSMQLFFKDAHNHIYYNISYQNFTQVLHFYKLERFDEEASQKNAQKAHSQREMHFLYVPKCNSNFYITFEARPSDFGLSPHR